VSLKNDVAKVHTRHLFLFVYFLSYLHLTGFTVTFWLLISRLKLCSKRVRPSRFSSLDQVRFSFSMDCETGWTDTGQDEREIERKSNALEGWMQSRSKIVIQKQEEEAKINESDVWEHKTWGHEEEEKETEWWSLVPSVLTSSWDVQREADSREEELVHSVHSSKSNDLTLK